MIKGYIHEGNFYKLTRSEAVAFLLFELKEKKRHESDIEDIKADVRALSRLFGIEGVELNALYNEVYGATPL